MFEIVDVTVESVAVESVAVESVAVEGTSVEDRSLPARAGGALRGLAASTGLARLAARAEDRLGHPVHPTLTDLPIGFWTSSWLLDLAGGRAMAGASRRLIGWGVLSALPTAAAGLGDLRTLRQPQLGTAAVHAASNTAALALYAASWRCRGRDHRLGGIALGMLGATAATVGGYLGGKLAFEGPATSG